MDEEKICYWCGEGIKKRKGQSIKAHTYELQHGAHIDCLRIHEGILRKYRISSNDYLKAIVDGLFQLFPEIKETKSVKEYNSRARKAKEEMEKAFPYIKELEKKEKAKKKEEKKCD